METFSLSLDEIHREMEEFSRPVESIMRCQDFKSNFARKLSNRYISRSPVSSPKQDTALKLQAFDSNADENVPDHVSFCYYLLFYYSFSILLLTFLYCQAKFNNYLYAI